MQSLVIWTQYKYFSLSTFQSTGDEMAARSNIPYTFVIWLKAVQSFSDIFLHSQRYFLELFKEIINIKSR